MKTYTIFAGVNGEGKTSIYKFIYYFSVGSIKDILTNPLYIGKIRYNLKQKWNEKRRRKYKPRT